MQTDLDASSTTFKGAADTSIFETSCLIGVWSVFALLALAWLDFFTSGLSIYLQIVGAFIAATALTAATRRHNQSATSNAIAAATTLGLISVSVGFATVVFDNSWDGMAYHQLAVALLEADWNPIRDPHVMPWLLKQSRWTADISSTLQGNEIWIEHYPKGSWLLGAGMAEATGQIAAAKWLQIFLLMLSIGISMRGLKDLGLRPFMAAVVAVGIGASPVVIAQVGTNYVDGLLGSCTIMALGFWFSWQAHKTPGDLAGLLIAATLMSSIKFTGAVYACILLTLVVVSSLRGSASLAAFKAKIPLAVALVGALMLVPTYGHNLLVHGFPFHPLQVTDVMKGQASPEFLEMNRLTKWWLANVNEPDNVQISPTSTHPFIPKLWHFEKTIQQADTRLAGFGPLFPWMLVLSGAALAVAAWQRSRPGGSSSSSTHQTATSALIWGIGFLVCCTLVNPEMWWARYVPFLWATPVLAAVLAMQVRPNWPGRMVLGMALLSVALLSAFQFRLIQDRSSKFEIAMREFIDRGELIIPMRMPDRGVMGSLVLSEYATERGIAMRFDALTTCKTQLIGIVPVCGAAKDQKLN